MPDDSTPAPAEPPAATAAPPPAATTAQPDQPGEHPAAGAASAPVTAPEPDTGYTPSGVPTLEGVREKIETRYGTALGATELAEETPEARAAAERYAARQKAAEEKIAEIRATMPPPD